MKKFLLLLMVVAVQGANAAIKVVDGVVWYYEMMTSDRYFSEFCISGPYARIVSGIEEYAGDLTVPSSLGGCPVAMIGNDAFNDCGELTSVTVPESVKSIECGAFSGCCGLTRISLPFVGMARYISERSQSQGELGWIFGNTSYAGAVQTKQYYDMYAYATYYIPSALKSVVVTDEEDIPDGAFAGCSGLRSVALGKNAKKIGAYAFYKCSSLSELKIPRGVSSIGAAAFQKCDGLKTLEVPEGVVGIGNYTFSECNVLENVVLPKSVTSIGYMAFYNCRALKSMSIPPYVWYVGDYAFSGCGLESVFIPECVTHLGQYSGRVFPGCYWLMSVTIPSCVTTLSSTFPDAYRKISKVVILEGVTRIASGGFAYCSGMTEVTIPSSVTSIGDNAFTGCSALGAVYVDKGDSSRIKGLYDAWPDGVEFVEVVTPSLTSDLGATVTGDSTVGFVIRPSAWNMMAEVMIPRGMDAGKVTVEVTPTVQSVKPNGAKVKVVVGENDITDCLIIPESDGVMNIVGATVKEEIVKETLDPSKDAVIELNAANPRLTTAPTRKGLTYTLFEGHKLESLSKGDSKLGDGDPWEPTITVSGGDAAFYSICVSK